MDSGRKWLVDFNAGKTQLLSFAYSNNTGAIDVKCMGLFLRKNYLLRILTVKKHPKIKLQHLRKIQIRTFGSMVHQINSFYKVLKLEQILQKNKVVTGKAPLFVIGPFWSCHSICLNTGF